MESHKLRLPTVAEYVTAFRAIEPEIAEKQREMLRVHHAAPARTMSATRLAEAVGFENYNGVNLQYGLLADKVARQLALDLANHVHVGVLVEFVDPGHAANEHWLWVMRPNVAQALEDLGWAPRVSHLLYPDLALDALGHEAPPAVFDAALADDADERFWEWHNQNPGAFYINYRSPNDLWLHRVPCPHLNEYEEGNATNAPKICSSSEGELKIWAEQGGHPSPRRCKDC
jgi:hypothetical protein